MERELAQRCKRKVRVAEFVDTDANSTATSLLFAGYVEVLYAQKAWLAVRVDIWTSNSNGYYQVKSLSAFLRKSEADVALVTSGEVMKKLQQVKELDLSVAIRGEEQSALTGQELTNVLEKVAQEVVEVFRKVQVEMLQNGTSQRAKFEYELLQYYCGLEVLVLKTPNSASFVLFALPLFEEETQWDTKKLGQMEDPESVFIPDGFNIPHFSEFTDKVMIFMGYPLKNEDETKLGTVWPLFVEWPAKMGLSSQVTQISPSSKTQSSIELISSCKQMFLLQWRRRKDFIAELRRHVIVLEYDAVDFSQTFFILQEQLDMHSPLRIIVLRLQFTAAFFLTNCTSDLQVTMLDGESSVTVSLAASRSVANPESIAVSQEDVSLFLKSTRKSLLMLFYGE